MKVRFRNLKWEKGDAKLVQGVKNNKTPKNAVKGGCGSFICATPSSLILEADSADGYYHSWNIINQAKAVNNWERLSENRVNSLRDKLRAHKEFEVDDNDLIKGLAKLVKV